MDASRAKEFISAEIDSHALPTLMDYVRVPSVSPSYDPDWNTNGYMQKAMDILLQWVDRQQIKGLRRELIEHPKCPPIVYMEVEATAAGLPTVLIYGHMDKQPPFTGWSDFCGPYTPAVKDGILYGRGSVDDGYSTLSAILAIKAIQEQSQSHGRIVIIIENEEESEGENILANLDLIKQKVGEANFIVCLDSASGDFKHLWMTSSLRGFIELQVKVKILNEGVHSGNASGIIPSTFRIVRQLLDRLEDSRSGDILLPQLYAPISTDTRERMLKLSSFAGDYIYKRFPFVSGALPVTTDLSEALLNGLMRPTLSVTGASGLPETTAAGNVLRPETTLKLSIRTPPGVDEAAGMQAVIDTLTANPPYGSEVSVSSSCSGKGWAMRPMSAWLTEVARASSLAVFGAEPLHVGEGGSIPLMRSLQDLYPQADFLITGILGPQSNAHGPDENMSIAFWKEFTTCLALILHGHSRS